MEKIHCGKHGMNNIVVCCQHLSVNKKSDEIFLVPELEADEAMVWCATCESARLKDNGWFDDADEIADWKLVCASCLTEITEAAKQVNQFEGERTAESF